MEIKTIEHPETVSRQSGISAGRNLNDQLPFIPASAGIQRGDVRLEIYRPWVPAFAGTNGMTNFRSFPRQRESRVKMSGLKFIAPGSPLSRNGPSADY